MLVISFSLANMFDSIGTLVGAAKQSGMIDKNGEIPHMKEALMPAHWYLPLFREVTRMLSPRA